MPDGSRIGQQNGLLRVLDGQGGVALLPFTVTVTAANTPPTITSTPTGPAVAGRPYEYRVAAQDADGDPLTYSFTGTPPENMSLDSVTGVLTWTPNAAQVGDHPVSITVSDNRDGAVTQSFTLSVVVPVSNTAPVISSHPSGPATVGVPYQYRVEASDPDGDPISFALTTAPDSMVIDRATGALTWTPTAAQVGDNPVVIAVSDGRGGVTTQSFALPVVPTNAPPAITSTPVGPAVEERPYVYVVTATDPDGDPITFSLTTAPDGMAIDAASGVLTWTPDADQIGDNPVTISVSDGRGGVRTQSFTLPVVADTPETPNAAPVITSTPFGPARAGSPYRYVVTATDPDGDPISFSLTTAPDGMAIDAASGVLTWTPDVDQIGDNPVSIVVSDGRGGVRTQSFTLPVVADTSETPNAAPVITSTPGGPAVVGFPYTYPVTATDADGDVLSFTLGNAPSGMTIDPTTGVLAWTPTAAQVGSFAVVVLVSDGRDTVSQSFTLPAIATDRPPAFTSTPPGPAEVGVPYLYRAVAVDPDGDPVIYTLVDAPSGMSIQATTGVVTWTPDVVGAATFVVRATARGVAVDQTVSLTIQASGGPNQPPVLSGIPTGPAIVGHPWTYTPTATDPDGDTVHFALPVGPAGMTIDPTTETLTWTPGAEQVGDHTVTLRATDARGTAVEQSFTLPVVADPAPNRSPVVTGNPQQVATVGGQYQAQITATDPDGDPLTFTATTLPAGMTLSASGVLTWTPTTAQVGSNPVSLRVSDGRGGEASVQYAITVSSIIAGNTSPQFTSTPNLYATVGALYAYDAQAIDADGDALVWSLDSAPAGASIHPTLGTLRWTPTAAGLGQFVVRVTDARGASVTQRFGIAVAGVNSAPLITSTPITRAAASQVYAYAVGAFDPDGDPVSFSLTAAPSGMTINATTGLIRWTPAAALIGTTADVTVLVSDNRGGSQPQSFQVAVTASTTNRAPSFTFTPKQYAVSGSTFTDLAVASDPDGDPITYSVTSGGDLGFTVNPTTGAISWTNVPAIPTGQPYSDVVVGLRVTDSFGAASGISYGIRIRPANNPPTIQAVTTTTVTTGAIYTYDVLAADADFNSGFGESLTYSVNSTGPMTIDSLRGTLRLDATGMATGTEFPVTVTVTDAAGATASTGFTLRVVADTTAPVVRLTVSPDATEVDVGMPITVRVTATDNIAVAGVSLEARVNDGPWQPITLDSFGRGTLTPTEPGTWELRAEATDGANSTATTRTFGVTDPSVDRPTVSLSPLSSDGRVQAPTAVSGSVANATNGGSLTWKLEAIPSNGSGSVRVVATGTGEISGHLGDFDPTILANGVYTLRLTATNSGGTSTAEVSVEVAGALKLGNFTVAFTDLSIPVAGIPITVTRVYDSLDAGKEGDFGYGWHLELGGYTITADSSTLDNYGGFRRGTRVSVRRPDGTTDGYTFDPQPGTTLFGIALDYRPYFRPDSGVINRLSVDPVSLSQIADGEFVVLDDYGNLSYNPARFGGVYEVTEQGGLVYTVDAQTGAFASVQDRNGNELTFTDEGIVSNRGVAVTFERDYRGRITAITDPRGNSLRYTYDAAGNLVSAVNRADESLGSYEYLADPAHYLSAIYDAKGAKAVGASYDAATGRLTALEDAAGESATFGYAISTDPNVAERATQTVSVPSTQHPGTDATTTVALDGQGNVTRTVDPLGRVTLSTYNALHQPLEVRQVVGEVDSPENGETDDLVTTTVYDSVGNPITVTAPGGAVTRTVYDSHGLPTSVIDPLGNPTYLSYDSHGNLLSTRSAEGVVSAFAYDSHGNLTSVTRGDATSTMTYDAQGRVASTVDPSGNITTYAYDANGNRTGTTRTWTNPDDPLDIRTLTTSVVYDGNDRVRFNTDELGNVSETRYDALGRAFQSVDSLGNVTETVFDERGLAVEVRSADGTISRTAYDAQGRAIYSTDTFVPGQATVRGTHTVYDDAGEVVRTERLDGLVIDITVDGQGTGIATVSSVGTVLSASETKYDALGRAYWTRDAAGLESTTYFDAAGRAYKNETKVSTTETLTTWTEFDAAGRVVASYDAAGVPTYTTYDADGRVTKITFADGSTQQTGYDSQGRKAFEIDAVGQQTDYGYDSLGRLVTVTLPAVTDAKTGLTSRPVFTYGYDKYGNQVTIADPYGRVTQFHFDEFGRSTGRTLPAVDGVRANEFTVYDKYGNVDYSIDFNGQKTDRVYDYNLSADGKGLGRLVEVRYYETGVATPSITMAYTYDALGRRDTLTETAGPTVRVTDYDYNVDGQIITITSPEGIIHYEYDAVTGRQTAMWTSATRIEYGYDVLGRMTTVTEVMRNGATLSDPQVTAYTYTAVGQIDTVTVTSGSDVLRQTTNEYDSQRHWLTGIVNEDGAGSLLSSFEYTRRADGQITYVSERVQQPDGSIITGTTSYTYDTLNRLILEEYDGAEVGSDYTIDYGLDLVGNRYAKTVTNEGETPVTTTSEYDDRDRLTVETTGSQVVEYTYDANGSLTMKLGGDEVTSYDWDAMGRMASATVTTDGVKTTNGYRYTADGIRAAVTDGAVTTRYVVDPMSPSGYAQVVEKWSSEASGEPVLLESTVYGLGLDPVSQYVRDQGTGLFLPDGHSGPRQVIDGSGAVLLVQRWDAYGNVMAKAGTFATDVTYRGERANGIGGGIYLRARMYDPASGRFGSVDPYSGNYGNILEAMRYGYAGNNPVAGMDPTGRSLSASVGISAGGFSSSLSALGTISLQVISVLNTAITVYNIADTVFQLVNNVVIPLAQGNGGFGGQVNLAAANSAVQQAIKDLGSASLSSAVDNLRRNLPRIMAEVTQAWISTLVSKYKSTRSWLVYLPTPIVNPGITIDIPIPGVTLANKGVSLSMDGRGGSLTGAGLATTMPGTKRRLQFWRMDYHPMHAPKPGNVESVWSDGPFHYHVVFPNYYGL
ncbi:MAG: putative Ig domain-containing protein [Bacteroidales bacterium]|nr:putative Ig domain-containing protein [Bacteroidales bacterium]